MIFAFLITKGKGTIALNPLSHPISRRERPCGLLKSSNYPIIRKIKSDRAPISLLLLGALAQPPQRFTLRIVCCGSRYKSRIQQQTSVFGAAVVVLASTFITALVLDQPPIHLCITRPRKTAKRGPFPTPSRRSGGARRLYTCNFNSPTGLSGALSKNKEVA